MFNTMKPRIMLFLFLCGRFWAAKLDTLTGTATFAQFTMYQIAQRLLAIILINVIPSSDDRDLAPRIVYCLQTLCRGTVRTLATDGRMTCFITHHAP